MPIELASSISRTRTQKRGEVGYGTPLSNVVRIAALHRCHHGLQIQMRTQQNTLGWIASGLPPTTFIHMGTDRPHVKFCGIGSIKPEGAEPHFKPPNHGHTTAMQLESADHRNVQQLGPSLRLNTKPSKPYLQACRLNDGHGVTAYLNTHAHAGQRSIRPDGHGLTCWSLFCVAQRLSHAHDSDVGCLT
jgi:hypothetical protein